MKKHTSLLTSYIVGFVLSIILTLIAYSIVDYHVASHHIPFSHEAIIVVILILAFIQLGIQLLFFLHIGNESKPRWNLMIFLSFAGVIFIMVVGSLWIMAHLNYNMTPQEMGDYLLKDEGMHE